jgi:hypothetical protein
MDLVVFPVPRASRAPRETLATVPLVPEVRMAYRDLTALPVGTALQELRATMVFLEPLECAEIRGKMDSQVYQEILDLQASKDQRAIVAYLV